MVTLPSTEGSQRRGVSRTVVIDVGSVERVVGDHVVLDVRIQLLAIDDLLATRWVGAGGLQKLQIRKGQRATPPHRSKTYRTLS